MRMQCLQLQPRSFSALLDPKSIGGIDVFAGGVEMPLLHTDLKTLYKSVSDIAAGFKDSRGISWNVAEIPSTVQSKFKIRASDVAPGDHQCWIAFSASQVDQGVALDTTMCNKGHYASKLHKGALAGLIHLHGLPPNADSDATGAPAQPPSQRPSSGGSIPIHPAFQKFLRK